MVRKLIERYQLRSVMKDLREYKQGYGWIRAEYHVDNEKLDELYERACGQLGMFRQGALKAVEDIRNSIGSC